ncbi:uncharacterized protein N7482_009503 [Penicillium canariense]|uniref:Uncharacterized protein n=1 Tax=Penicillium canariense TaxID=189055 RepID=A0A9W9HQY6_9EURO|nr:uncharacterized protein N7482_009503 [Penicillium canariense]KAJ5153025.1 hypothetical protein N7482_009503 [Penicillium canariense]
MSNKVVLIFGYGPNVGFEVAKAFATRDYKVAVVSRSDKCASDAKNYLQIQADLADPSSIEGIFSQVIDELGHPTVVIYNAASFSFRSSSPLNDQIVGFQSDNNVNIVSAYIAAYFAIRSFALAPSEASKTFIYTGNKLPFLVVPPLLSPGAGKAAAAHLIHYLAEEHKDQGYKFYYADERKSDGDPVYSAIDGSAHAEFYTQLSEHQRQGPWNATFVKGQGYVRFSEEMIQDAVFMGRK